jgi:hypothetical protein
MDDHHLFDELLRAAGRLGVAVRLERFETAPLHGGGLCVVRGTRLVLIDQGARVGDRVLALARALAELETERIYMVPAARELVEAIRIGGIRNVTGTPTPLTGLTRRPR